MKITEISVQRPVLVSVVFFVVTLFGAASLKWLPIDLFPDIEMPVITVLTVYPGASAADVEEKVSKVLEDALGALENLDEISSMSQENISALTLKFDFGTDLGETSDQIRQALEMTRQNLPEGIESPMQFQIDMSQMPVVMFAVLSDTGDVRLLGDWVDDHVLEPLERLPGVGTVISFGAPPYQLIVDVNRDAMLHYGVTMEALEGLLNAENFSIPAGDLEEGVLNFMVRMPAEFGSIEDAEQMIVRRAGNSAVRLMDVASVRRDLEDQSQTVGVDGRQALVGVVMKQSDANIVDVSDAVHQKLTELESTLPGHFKVVTIMDNARFIRLMIDNLFNTLWLAIGLVVLIVFLFLRRVRSSLIVAIALPVSLVVVFLALYLGGHTLNIISMMAIILGIGMVVDNGIVVLESITRHVEAGLPPARAAVVGTREVGSAIAASTLTTLSIFGPLIFVSGLIAQMFGQLAYVVSVTIGSSLIVALTLTPSMGARLLKNRVSKGPDGKTSPDVPTAPRVTMTERIYARILSWSLGHRWVVVALSFAIAGTTFYFLSGVGFDFMPASNSGDLQLTVELPLGTATAETAESARRLVEEARKLPEVEHGFFRGGRHWASRRWED